MSNRKRAITLVSASLLLVATLLLAPAAHALTMSTGVAIVAIDGDSDSNVTVDVTNIMLNSPYTYGYFLNGGSTFHQLTFDSSNPLATIGTLSLQGGDIIDLALFDSVKYYTLSGDAADDTYSVKMDFLNPVTTGSPQQPAGWTAPYYYDGHISWTFTPVNIANELELSLNFSNGGNDGIAPAMVPETSALILLGTGLTALGLVRRRFWKKG